MDRHTRAGFLLLLTGAAAAAQYTVLDVQNVPLMGDPASAVVRVTLPGNGQEVPCDVLGAGVEVLEQMLRQPKLAIYLRTAIVAVERHGAKIESALAWQFDRRAAIRFRPRFVLDATEMGDLLPLARVPYVVGAEAKSDTG